MSSDIDKIKMREIKPAASESYERKRGRSAAASSSETQDLIDFLSAGFGGTMSEDKNETRDISEEIEDKTLDDVRETAVLHCSDKSAEQAPTKRRSKDQQNVGAALYKKSNINNLDIINPSIPRACAYNSGDRIDVIDLQTEREFYFSVLKENISYCCLCEQHKYDKSRLDELLGIMLDVVCSTKPTIRVNGGELPKETVKSVFLKLDSDHIDYVLDALKKNTSKVRNIRAYLITALYNAPSTIDSYYQAAVNYDLSLAGQAVKKAYANYEGVS